MEWKILKCKGVAGKSKSKMHYKQAFAPTLRCLSWMKVSKWCLSNKQALNLNFLGGLVKFRRTRIKSELLKRVPTHFARFGKRGGRTLQQAKFELIRQVTHDLLLFYLDWIYEYVMLLSFYWSFVEHKIYLFTAHRARELLDAISQHRIRLLRCLSWMKASKWWLSNRRILSRNFLEGLVKFRWARIKS